MRWTDPALDDLGAIYDYIAAHNPDAAARVLARIGDAAANLDTFPDMGRIGRRRGTRELVIAGLPYFLVYQLNADIVEIVRVIHGARDWPRRG